ncbi:hypothetical protein SAMN05421812_105247 [Asanoa hainanensis]|uniref:Trypsin n=1 Tax=Asanoa hainanensis TaxID=560556 RepID=A0A239MBM0_9ACTN|nr:hypothetical protein [Asanoa hainanensis]SNT39199.1 hypothetical protein SAMN05421812_105247 [Asanoa hainanensis]
MRPNRLALVLSGMAVMMLTGGVADIATAAAPASCRVDTRTTEESPAWLSSPAGKRVVEALAGELDRPTTAAAGKTDGLDALRAGIIGRTVDHQTKEIVVVIDPNQHDRVTLGRDLSQVADRARGAAAGPKVRVQAGCSSAAELLDAKRILSARDWHPQAAQASFMSYLDPADSRFHVEVDKAYPGVADALRARLGDRVDVTLGLPSRTDRNNDASPHKGGAKINDGASACTSGFAVRQSDGTRAAVTAGHCFDDYAQVNSGSQYYGFAVPRRNYPTYDMRLVTANNQWYTNVIHVDPCCPSARTVWYSGNPAVNSLVCTSGSFSLAKCGIRVLNWTGEYCDSYGCTWGLITGRRDDGSFIVQNGDSGAPVYSRPPGNNIASIHGMVVVGNGSTMMAELISGIEYNLNVTVATLP